MNKIACLPAIATLTVAWGATAAAAVAPLVARACLADDRLLAAAARSSASGDTATYESTPINTRRRRTSALHNINTAPAHCTDAKNRRSA